MQKWNLHEKLGKENLDCKSQHWRKSTVNRKVKVNGQLPVMTSARWRNLMTLVRADVAVMTSAGDPMARGTHEHVPQFSPKLLSARDGAWRV